MTSRIAVGEVEVEAGHWIAGEPLGRGSRTFEVFSPIDGKPLGEVSAGGEIKLLSRDTNAVPVSEVTRLYVAKHFTGDDVGIIRRSLHVSAFPESWKSYFENRLRESNL